MNYTLTPEQEDDFLYSQGQLFKDWLTSSFAAWEASAKENRRQKLLQMIPHITDEKVHELIVLVK